MKSISTLLLAMLFLFLQISCSNPDQDTLNKFSHAIDMARGDSTIIISFRKVTSFDWDTLYIFTPYTRTSQIEEQLGFKWNDKEFVSIEFSDRINLFILRKDNAVVSYFELPISSANVKLNSALIFSKGNARFRIKEELIDTQLWPYLVPVTK